jgi:large subunit ribosomal protein L17
MRHGKKINHLGRTSAHRKSLLANLASALIKHKRIETTVAKAKALQRYVEPLLTKAKQDTTHSRRIVFSNLKDKDSITELFREISVKIATRPGGYTRVIKMGARQGDAAEMAIIELVDYNDVYVKETKAVAKKTTRRSTATKKKSDAPVASENATEAPKEE